MMLPNAEQAVVPQNKIENYLLDLAHPIGGAKAQFFMQFGFRRNDWIKLAEAIRWHGIENAVKNAITDADGTTYLVEGPIITPSGRNSESPDGLAR